MRGVSGHRPVDVATRVTTFEELEIGLATFDTVDQGLCHTVVATDPFMIVRGRLAGNDFPAIIVEEAR